MGTRIESFVNESTSFYSIQSLKPTTLLKIQKDQLESLYQSIPKTEQFFRLTAQNMLIAVQRKVDIFQQMKSKERYEHFRSHFPSFFQRVP